MRKILGSFPLAVVLTTLIVAFCAVYTLGSTPDAMPEPIETAVTETQTEQVQEEQTEPEQVQEEQTQTNTTTTTTATTDSQNVTVQYGAWCYDAADVLSRETENEVAKYNKQFDEDYSSYVAVLTVNYSGSDITSYAQEVFKTWGLEGNDLLLLLNTNDQLGYLFYGSNRSDIDVTEYLEKYSDPYTLKGNYDSAVSKMLSALDENYFPYTSTNSNYSNNNGYYQEEYYEEEGFDVIGLLVFLLIAFIVLRRIIILPFFFGGGRRRGHYHDDYHYHSHFHSPRPPHSHRPPPPPHGGGFGGGHGHGGGGFGGGGHGHGGGGFGGGGRGHGGGGFGGGC